MGYYYSDPSGGGAWWVPDGMQPGQAMQYWADLQDIKFPAGLQTKPQAYSDQHLTGGIAKPAKITQSLTQGTGQPLPGQGPIPHTTNLPATQHTTNLPANTQQPSRSNTSTATPSTLDGAGGTNTRPTFGVGGQPLTSNLPSNMPRPVAQPSTGQTNAPSTASTASTASATTTLTGDLNTPEGLSNAVTQLINQIYTHMPGAVQLFGDAGEFAKTLTTMMNSDRALRDQLLPMLTNPGEFETAMRGMLEKNMNDTGLEDDIKFGIGEREAERKKYLDQVMGNRDIENALPGLMADRDKRVNSAYDPTLAEINRSMSERDRGLSEEAKSALYGQSKENAVRGYGTAATELKSMLGRSGALGGEMPGAEGDIIRSFSPLLSERERAVSEGDRQTTLADEAAKTASRDRALKAADLGGSLTNIMGNIYDPAKITDILQGAQSTRNAGGAAIQNAFSPDALVNALVNARAGRNNLSGDLIGGINQAGANRTGLFNAVNNAYSGEGLMNGINNAYGNQTNAMNSIMEMYRTMFGGVNTMGNLNAAKENTNWIQLLLTSVLGSGTNATGTGWLDELAKSGVDWAIDAVKNKKTSTGGGVLAPKDPLFPRLGDVTGTGGYNPGASTPSGGNPFTSRTNPFSPFNPNPIPGFSGGNLSSWGGLSNGQSLNHPPYLEMV